MQKRLRLVLVFIVLWFSSFAQSQVLKISGIVLNEKNEALAGVSVKIIGLPGGASTDLEGRFTLHLSAGKKYELEISAVGYESKIIPDVEVVSGAINEMSIVLVVEAKTTEAVTVTSRSNAKRETVNAIIS